MTIEKPPEMPEQESGLIEPGLPSVGVRREVRVAGIRVAGRRRRPSGEKAALRGDLDASGRVWLLSGLIMIAIWVSLFAFPATADWWTRQDTVVLRRIVDIRSSALTSVADAIAFLGTGWFLRVLRIGTLLALVFVHRWRHFFAVVLAILLVQGAVEIVGYVVGRHRPFVEIIGSWEGPSHPSAPVAGLAVTLAAMAFVLVPAGKWRHVAFTASGIVLAIFILAQLYLGVDHPSDAYVSAIFAPAVTIVLFRWFAPDYAFPVTWKRGVAAHLDVSGRRGEAIRRAVGEQIGLHVLDIEPFGLEGSGTTELSKALFGLRATRISTSLPSCTATLISVLTAGTRSAEPSCMARWRMRFASHPCAVLLSMRTTSSG